MIGLMMTPGTSGSITGTSGMGGVVGSGLSVIEKSGIGSWEGSTMIIKLACIFRLRHGRGR